jgi:outer membrane receptor protein involved in Fe transport
VSAFSELTRRINAATATMTRFVDRGGVGSHELKIGVEHERTRRQASFEYPGGALYLDRNGAPEIVRFWAGETTRPRHHRTSLFAQDNWQIVDRVTLEPGLRVGFYDSALPDVTMRLYENHSISPRLGIAWTSRAIIARWSADTTATCATRWSPGFYESSAVIVEPVGTYEQPRG